MSQLRVNDAVNVSGTGPISVSLGASVPSGQVISGAGGLNLTGVSTATFLRSSNVVVSGVVTATTFSGSGSGLTDITISGSGKFNPGINSITPYTPTTSMATAYTAPATASTRQIIHSVLVTNIDTTLRYVSGEMYSGGISIGSSIPIPVGTTVELLQQPKIMSPSETIKLQCDANSALSATITAEQKTADTSHFGSGIDVTSATTFTDLHTATANSVIQSILVVNDSNTSDTRVRVAWTDGSNNIRAYYAYDLLVPYSSSVEILDQPKYLPNGNKIRVYVANANRIEAIIAGKTL